MSERNRTEEKLDSVTNEFGPVTAFNNEKKFQWMKSDLCCSFRRQGSMNAKLRQVILVHQDPFLVGSTGHALHNLSRPQQHHLATMVKALFLLKNQKNTCHLSHHVTVLFPLLKTIELRLLYTDDVNNGKRFIALGDDSSIASGGQVSLDATILAPKSVGQNSLNCYK
ncbi:hypothetical protein PoB_000982900 [Plakobranchus ocellatus]|uniref:Uncharacterized protein n=1 Tax=Plakobranchus ocellatus TaxID=259542 RepID=A0AAV3YJX9_9GAST|nr:hypothetical protein PoB_000982900 [Plakobranchus ocellatus]